VLVVTCSSKDPGLKSGLQLPTLNKSTSGCCYECEGACPSPGDESRCYAERMLKVVA
jgi:hypothetical protein